MGEVGLSAPIGAGIEAFNRGDYESVLALVTDDVEWQRVDTYVVYWLENGRVRRIENWRTREGAERSSGLLLA